MKLTCPDCARQVFDEVGGAWFKCRVCNRSHPRKDCLQQRQSGPKSRTTRGRSDRQEKHTARRYSGQRTANSGALDDKGDVVVRGRLRIEDKTTKSESYTLRERDLQRLAGQAQGDEMPVFKVAFRDNLAAQYVILPQAWFDELLERAEWLTE